MEMTRESRRGARSWFGLVTVGSLLVICRAGPLPNVTFTDNGTNSGSCSVGDVVYMPGDNFPGATPCERCSCAAGGVQCAKQTCEARPGCKAVHRPDHCCPTYQCECEQDGRVYGNGEKLVDPHDPCRVCYCQGGEVVCRRISCFLRDDCKPRLVIGRCCPEYDDCPLTGVSTISGLVPSSTAIEEISLTSPSPPPAEKPKPEITIKEITPVSEIPVVTDVKIKEVLPSPSIDIGEYSSSKSPLITREATSERSISSESNADIANTSTLAPSSQSISAAKTSEDSVKTTDFKSNEESSPSKISLSTQEKEFSTSTDKTVPPVVSTQAAIISISTKAPVIEDEEPTPFEHNPAFPPIPDDLSVPRNQEEDVILEINVDNNGYESSAAPTTVAQPIVTKKPLATTEATTTTSTTSVKSTTTTTSTTTLAPKTKATEAASTAEKLETTTFKTSEKLQELTTQNPTMKQTGTKISPMINLRAAIPTELLNEPLAENDDINGELDDDDTTSTTVRLIKKTTTPTVHVVTPVPTISLKSTEISNEPVIVVLSTPTTSDEKFTLKQGPISVAPDMDTIKISDVAQSTEIITQKPLRILTSTSQSPSKTEKIVTEQPKRIKIKLADNPAILATDVTTAEIVNSETTTITPRTDDLQTFPSNDKVASKSHTEKNLPETSKIQKTVQNESDLTFPKLATESTASLGKVQQGNIQKVTTLETVPIVDMHATTTLDAEASEVSTVHLVTPTSIKILATEAEPITIAREPTPRTDIPDSLETTEFIITPQSSDTTTTNVELIKPLGSDKNAQIIEAGDTNKNMLKDFISLVGDVASISGHTDETGKQKTPGSFSESEELITVSTGYKSKNKNWNINSISEVTTKPKNVQSNKAKGVEMENEDVGNITDLPPPNDKMEPTTQLPIIDKVTDDMPGKNKTEKDIEIIKQSYVPTKPSKLIEKSKKPASEEVYVSGSQEDSTDDGLSIEEPTTVAPVPVKTPLRFSALKSTSHPVPQ